MNKKVFNNVKNLEFDVRFIGRGVVNFDGEQNQKIINWKKGLLPDNRHVANTNVKYAKKVYKDIVVKEEDGTEKVKSLEKLKISSACLRHAMFGSEMEFDNPAITFRPLIRLSAIASPAMIERGYAHLSNDSTKKSVFCIVDAIEIGPYHDIIELELHSTSGHKGESKESKDDPGNTSLFYTESVGDIEYETKMFIDLTELQFVSNDITYDRNAIGTDHGPEEEFFLEQLNNNLSGEHQFGFYYMKQNLMKDEWAERGILFSRENVDFLTKDIIKRLMNVFILRKDAYAKFKDMEVTVYMDGGRQEKIIINSVSDIDNFEFNYYQTYYPADEEKILHNKKAYEDLKKAQKEAARKAKEEARKKKNKKSNEE